MPNTSRNRTQRIPLTQTELERMVNDFMTNDDEDEACEPFSSDDSVADADYDANECEISTADESSSSGSSEHLNVHRSPPRKIARATVMPIQNDSDNEWTDTEEDPIDIPFTATESINVNIPNNATALQYFQVFFDNSIILTIVEETNRRANLFLANQETLTRSNKGLRWIDTTPEEIKTFIGVCCLSGNITFPKIARQWSKDPLYYHPIFGKSMSRNRFTTILRMLRFVNHADVDVNDRLHKIRPILNAIIENIKSAFYPGQHLAIDEAMILWRGRLIFRQYIPNKRHKYGIKLYELTTHDGFILNIIIYVGKGTLEIDGESHSFSVVKQLIRDYLGKGHVLYVDNFYSSVALAEYLLSEKTGIVGTLRENRKGNPKKFLKTKLKKGEAVWKRKGSVVVTKWKDKRDVRMMSTRHKHQMVETRPRRGEVKLKPQCVLDYNQHMSGIDRADQMMSYYSSPRKTIRWYRKIFFHLVDVCIWNAYYLYKKRTNTKKTLLDFRDEIIKDLIKAKPLQANSIPVNFQGHHFPEAIPGEKKNSKRCRFCSKGNVRRRSRYHCPSCPDLPGLCIDPCFKNWHLSLDT